MMPSPDSLPVPLFRLRGETQSKIWIFDLGPGEYRVGSSSQCEIRLGIEGVSRHHAILEAYSDALLVADGGSKNGTFLNGQRIDRAAVPAGAELRFGPVRLRVEMLKAPDRMAIRFNDDAAPSSLLADGVSTAVAGAGLEKPGDASSELVFPERFCRGSSAPARELYDALRALRRSRLPVLIHGETGVGKELVARTLHLSSGRPGPFEAVNCAAIPGELMEAELFGIRKGVATGVDERPGLFERAQGGTLFLDEIGELTPPLQAKLLRVLQEKEVQPIGGRPQELDVRVLSATHIDLEREVGQRLRQDLYYRLAGSIVEVPTLRRCRDDIPALLAFFLSHYAHEIGVRLRGVTAGAVSCLTAYDWPGNVRELEHTTHRLALHSRDGALIDVQDLDARIRAPRPHLPILPEALDSLALNPRLEAVERALIKEALMRAGGRLGQAAKLLEISRNGLAKKMKRLDLKGTWAIDDR